MLINARVVRPCAAVVLFAALAATPLASAAAVDLPLIDAVKRQDAAAVRQLLSDGTEVDGRQPDGATALHWATYREDLDTVDLLLRAGADVDAVNRLGATPLWLAASATGARQCQMQAVWVMKTAHRQTKGAQTP